MSSSNKVRVIMVPETSYGTPPVLGAATPVLPVRFTSEALSGTPQLTESAEARNDRMSGGQIVTGLESGGAINFELSREPCFDKIFEMAMLHTWQPAVAMAATHAATLTMDATDPQVASIVFTGANFDNVDGAGNAYDVGDVVILSGFSATNKANGPRQILGITLPNILQVSVPRGTVNEAPSAAKTSRPEWLDIFDVVSSVTLSKSYDDVIHEPTTDIHSQSYPGSLVNQLQINMSWGAIVTGAATFVSNGYTQEAPSLAQKIDAAGGTVPAAGDAQPLNGSIDMPMVTVGGEPTDFCIESMNFTLNNNLTPQTCLGKIAPTKYSPGTAQISLTVNIYLSDPSYDKFMPAKLTQAPVALLFVAQNQDGGYAFDFRQVQLSFPDPASAGRDQQVMIAAAGVAKVGNNGESALRIYRY